MATINNIADYRTYVSLNSNMEFSLLTEYINTAEEDYLKPVLGDTLYAAVVAAYEGSASTPILDGLLPYVQRPVAWLATHMGLTLMQLQFSDTGVHIVSTETNKTAFKWQIGDAEVKLHYFGMRAIDRLYMYLEANKASFPTWTNSTAYTEFNELYLQTADQFNTYYNINRSRVTFVDLRPAQRRVLDFYVKPVLGDDLHTELMAYLNGSGSSSTDDNATLDTTLDKIRQAMAYLSINEANDLALKLQNGAILSTRIDAEGNTSTDNNEPRGTVKAMQKQAGVYGNSYLNSLQRWLHGQAYAGNLPTFKQSSTYTSGGDDEATVAGTIVIDGKGAVMI